MKIPSLNYLTEKTVQSFLRFPLSIISSAIAVTIGIYLIEYGDDIKNIFPYLNTLLCLALGIPLFFLASVFSETQRLAKNKMIAIQVLGGVIVFLIFLSLPNIDDSSNTSLPYIRYGIYNVIIHLAVSFFPYLSKGNLNGFWEYNKTLFLRLLASVIYSGFLYAGLCIALVSLKLLFDIKIPDNLWFELYIVIIVLFNTWFFVSGIPKDFEQLEQTKQYPKGLKVFTQFILLPLLILYLFILYAYMIKIVYAWTWPNGIVSYLITFVSVLGIFANLLIYPFSLQEGNSWISRFSKFYYYSLVPLIVVLFIAIGMRIEDYGITINRYVIIVLGIWLSLISIYFVLNKKNIKIIPMSLGLMMLLVSFGPWSMFSVSERSQVKRLTSILEDNEILLNGKIVNEAIWRIDYENQEFNSDNLSGNKGKLHDSLQNEVYSIVNYLDDHHGFELLNNWTTQNIDSLIKTTYNSPEKWKYRNEASIYMKTFGLEKKRTYSNISTQYEQKANYNTDMIKGYPITSFDYFIPISNNYNNKEDTIEYKNLDNLDLTLIYPKNISGSLNLFLENDSISFPLGELVQKISYKYNYTSTNYIEHDELILKGNGKIYNGKIFITRFQVADSVTITNFYGKLLLGKK